MRMRGLSVGAVLAVCFAGSAFAQTAHAECASASARIDKDFETGVYAACDVEDADDFVLTIVREDENVTNPSPWYAFRVTPLEPGEITVTLQYEGAGHRYRPKTSTDGVTWTALPDSAVVIEGERRERTARLSLDLGSQPVFVAAQEILPPSAYAEWLGGFAGQPFAQRSVLGQSAEGRDIEIMRVAAPEHTQRETVVLVGRQHPPEVSGALAMMSFVDTVMGDSDLAKAYRARFETLIVPMLNPDGVVRGHWRHNTGGVDLNRDWGPFTQPETALMGDLLAQVAADPARKLRVLIDFHSTGEDVFYTIPDELQTDPAFFTRNWLDLYQDRMPGYFVNREARHDPGRPISKAYAFDTYGVPGITFEIGDETDRALIERIGRESAYAMMVTMLEVPPLVMVAHNAAEGN